MKLQRIQIDGFGTLSDFQISDLTEGLNVYYGSNGSGKTTILHFLRGIFCGYDDARQLNLLPPLKGGTPGGGVSLADGQSRFMIVRRGRNDHADALAIQIRQGRADEAESLRIQIERLDCDLVHLLYFVGSYEAHSISDLVHLALRDGIDLTTTQEDANWITPLIQSVDTRRMSLWDGPSAPRLIGQQQAAIDHAVQMADQAERLQQTRQESVVDELQRTQLHLQRLDGEYAWLTGELQPVDSDLTECQNRLWSRRIQTVRSVQRITTPVTPAEPGWEKELHEVDRQIEHSKQVLRDLAAARLRLTLESTATVCAETPDEASTLLAQRDLLNRMEERLIELQTQGEADRQPRLAGSCDCESVIATWKQKVDDIRQLVYVLCQHLSRRQSVVTRQRSIQEQGRIDQCESEVLERIRRLRLRREEILASYHSPLAGRVRHAVSHELLACQCERHAEYASRIPPEFETPQALVRDVISERLVEESDAWPGDPDLEQRLLQRRKEILQQLFDLQRRIRDAHLRIVGLMDEQNRFADDHSVMNLRFSQQQSEDQLVATQKHWVALALQHGLLTEVQQRLRRIDPSPVIAEASALLNRLTQERYTRFQFEPSTKELFIQNAEGQLLSPSALSRGTLDQAALSFRLALVAEYARRGLRLPLVLDDVLVDSDEQRLASAVEILREVAGAGQQIIFLTCQEHLSDLFDELGMAVRSMPGSVRPTRHAAFPRGVVPSRSTSDVVAVSPSQLLLAPMSEFAGTPKQLLASPAPVSTSLSPESASRAADSFRVRLQPEVPYWLRVDSSIEHLPSLGPQAVTQLAALGINDIGELILFDAGSLRADQNQPLLTTDRLRQWQAEARLLVSVPDLTGPEGQLLSMIGIENPVELGQSDENVLIAQIAACLSHSVDSWAARLITDSSGNVNDWTNRDRVRTWIRNGRRAMSFRAARQWAGWKPRRLQDLDRGDWDHGNQPVRDRSTTDTAIERERSPRRRPRLENAVETHPLESHRTAPLQLAQTSETTEKPAETTRFYLHSDSPVVDAPSIGPKAAERLSALGIMTVHDFLSRSATWIAEQLDDARLNADVIRTWQLQSSLMCQVPGLRGHDAQILVACDLTMPEQIRSHTPEQLLELVGPFSASREGQRMLRSANPPDLDEVRDWIQWAGEARQLNAA